MKEKILLLVWVMQPKRKEWGEEKEKVDDEYPGAELWKGKYMFYT